MGLLVGVGQTKSNIIYYYTLFFSAPQKQFLDYNKDILNIKSIELQGANSIAYSIDNGKTFKPITLPVSNNIQIPAGWVIWQISFTPTSSMAGVAITSAY